MRRGWIGAPAFGTVPRIPENGHESLLGKARFSAGAVGVARKDDTWDKGLASRVAPRAMALGGVGTALLAAGPWATRQATHRPENPRNLTRPRAKEELVAYPFREPKLRMDTAVPFPRARERRKSDAVPALHGVWLSPGADAGGAGGDARPDCPGVERGAERGRPGERAGGGARRGAADGEASGGV